MKLGAGKPPSKPEFDSNRPAGWFADPFARHESRWWNGLAWTERARSNGIDAIDPPGINSAPAAAPMSQPAAPIGSEILPLKRSGFADRIALAFGCLVFLALVAVLVASLMV